MFYSADEWVPDDITSGPIPAEMTAEDLGMVDEGDDERALEDAAE